MPMACDNFKRAAAVLTVLASAALVGCQQGQPAAAAPQPVAPRVELRAVPVPGPVLADPLTGAPWRYADWTELSAPADQTPAAERTWVAAYYDAQTLYVGFICSDQALAKTPPNNVSGDFTGQPKANHSARAPAAAMTAADPVPDHVEVWLDTSAAQNGTDFVGISVTPDGQASTSWYRSTRPPMPRQDGRPDYTHPFSRIPGWTIANLRTVSARGQYGGTPAWGVVVAIPLEGLPLPLRTTPRAGIKWRINLLRVQQRPERAGGSQPTLAQANLSPVDGAAQEVAPYRMGDLVLTGPGAAPVAMQNQAGP